MIYLLSIHRLQRFEKTNEMLLNCNALSNGRLKIANDDFKKHIKLVNEMKKDLDYIFRKIRNIKARIGSQYPQAMKKVEQRVRVNSLTEDAREMDGESSSMAIEADAYNLNDEIKQTNTLVKSNKHSIDRQLSEECVTVNYVQMETSTDNGRCINSGIKIENEPVISANDTDNESSDTSDT